MSEIKIAVIGNYATQFLSKSLAKAFKNRNATLVLYNADFNSIDFEIIDEHSGLFKFEPDFIVWHESTLGLRDQFYQSAYEERSLFAQSYVRKIEAYLERIKLLLPKAKILFPNHSQIHNDNVFGNYAAKTEYSWFYQVTKLNALLNEAAVKEGNLFVFDSLNSTLPGTHIDYTQVVNAELHYTPLYLDWLSERLTNYIFTISGKFKKCIILDLDNTLWGGIIGDDGPEGIQIGTLGIGKAYTRLQKWLKELKNRGILLAVCSKNNQEVAEQPFKTHAEMILRLEDFAVFIANWNSKADNINTIREILNIGFDSMVFIDDNPAEREIVRKHIPEVEVPELPEDPAEYLPFLISMNLFETASFSHNDADRTQQYQVEAKRVELSKTITDMDAFLSSLKMKARVRPFTKEDVERVAQLTQRSNQFNLRTIRYTNQEIQDMIGNQNYWTYCLEMSDKFGSYGLVSVVILKDVGDDSVFIDTWIMSCRVLKRTVEQYLMNAIIGELKQHGFKRIIGEYLPTSKNKLVEFLLDELSLQKQSSGMYQLDISNYINLKTSIEND